MNRRQKHGVFQWSFSTCLIDQFTPQAGMDSVLLLEREGIRVHYAEAQTCCGQPAYSSGYPDEARSVALAAVEPVCRALAGGGALGLMRRHDAQPLPAPVCR
jgi:L-lactate dehydrogenase complex protein LldE